MREDTSTQQLTVRPLAVDTASAAAMLGVSKGTLENWRYCDEPKGPRFARIGSKVVYPVSEIERFLEANLV